MSVKLLYFTCFDPVTYPRPLFAQKALEGVKVVSAFRILEKGLVKHLSNMPRIRTRYLIFKNLADVLRSNGIICHNIQPFGDTLCRYGFLHGKRVIIDYMDVMFENGQLPRIDKHALSNVDGVIFWSKALRDHVAKKVTIKKYAYIPSGVDLALFDESKAAPSWFRSSYGFKEDERILMYFGLYWRLMEKDVQGIHDLIEAFSLIEKESHDVRLVLTFHPDEELRTFVRKVGVRKINFIGTSRYGCMDFLSRLYSADVLVLPTTNHPTVKYAEQHKLFIYMAARKPIVATETTGTRGILDEFSAIFVKPEKPASIAEGIIEALKNKPLAEEIASKAYEKLLRHYTWEKLVPLYRNFVSSCLYD